MSSAIVNFPPLRGGAPLVHEGGKPIPEAHQSLLRLYNGAPLQTVDTSGGNANFAVPLARFNQNVEISYVKISADVNAPTLVAQGTDTINGGASKAMGTAQYSHLKLKSDGVSNWYVTG